MKKSMNRRMFLRGTGGVLMALPFLPSLTTRAFAQEGEPPSVGRCFLGICTDLEMSGVRIPTPAKTSSVRDRIMLGVIFVTSYQPTRRWSCSVVRRISRFSQPDDTDLASKFNVLLRLDIPYYIATIGVGTLAICWNRKQHHSGASNQVHDGHHRPGDGVLIRGVQSR